MTSPMPINSIEPKTVPNRKYEITTDAAGSVVAVTDASSGVNLLFDESRAEDCEDDQPDADQFD